MGLIPSPAHGGGRGRRSQDSTPDRHAIASGEHAHDAGTGEFAPHILGVRLVSIAPVSESLVLVLALPAVAGLVLPPGDDHEAVALFHDHRLFLQYREIGVGAHGYL